MSQTEEQRRNLYEAQKAWAERVFGELTEEEAAEVRRYLRRLARARHRAEHSGHRRASSAGR